MAKIKYKTLKKLKKRRFWPAIVLFLIFSLISVMVITVVIELFSLYIIEAKLTEQYNHAMDTGAMMQRCMEEGDQIIHAVDYAERYSRDPVDVYVTDMEGRCVASTGDGMPLFDEELAWSFDEKNIVYKDSRWDYGADSFDDIADVFVLHVPELVRRTMEQPPEDMGEGGYRDSEWMKEPIMQQQFWLYVPAELNGYKLYVRCMLQMKRQDIIYIIILGGIALVLMFIPLVFLLINMFIIIRTQRQAAKVLYMDPLTGGNNWIWFQGAAGKMLGRLWNGRKTYALVNLHMERYSNYVSFFGSEEGEKLLECMDGFLRARMNRREAFGHHSSADFGLIFRCEGSDEEACRQNCYLRLRSLLAELAGLQPERKLHFHAGVFMIWPVVTDTDKRLMRRKDLDIDQMYSFANTAQKTAHTETEQIFFFNQQMLEEQSWEQWVENNMQDALASGEFQVWLQPKYRPADRRLVAAEALVRWYCPEKGMISPGQFIPIFERNGFVTRLDDYMLSQVAKLQAEWMVQGKKTVPISVNVSRVHFAHEGLAEHISRLVDSYGPKHELIELEVTESAFFDDKETLINTVRQLRAYGFPISMDDFGAGYSSLNSLKDIPLDVLKLDGEFFRGEDETGRGAIIVREAVCLAKELDMRVVAEGIEQREQVDFLASLGCDMIQGYYFAKPMPVAEFEERVAADA